MAKIMLSFKKSFLEKEGLTKESMGKCLAILSKEFKKAQDQHDFEYFKKRALACLKKQYDALDQEEKENKKVSKAFILAEAELEKAFPVGTIRTWKGKKFIKSPDKKWRPYYENHKMRGEKLALAALAKKINALQDGDYEGLYKLLTLYKSRFTSDGSLIKDLYTAMKTRGALGSGRFTKKEEEKSDIFFTEDEQQAMQDLNRVFEKGEITIENKEHNGSLVVERGWLEDKGPLYFGHGVYGMVDKLFEEFYIKKNPPYDVYRAGAFLQMLFERLRHNVNNKEDFKWYGFESSTEKNVFYVTGVEFTNKKSYDLKEKANRLRASNDQGALLFLDNVQKMVKAVEKTFILREEYNEKRNFEEERESYKSIKDKKEESIFSLETDEKDESNNYKIKRDFENRFTKSLVGEGVEESPEEIMNEIYDLFDNCGSDATKKVFEKYFKKVHIKNTNYHGGGFYSPGNNWIEFDLHEDMHPDSLSIGDRKSTKTKHETLLHECFHAIENNFEKQKGFSTKTMYQTVKQEDGTEKRVYFADVIRQDALKYIEKRKSEMQEKFDSIVAENKDRSGLVKDLDEAGFFFDDSDEKYFFEHNENVKISLSDRLVRNAISEELIEINKQGKCGIISDMIESVTGDDDCVGIVHGGIGHSVFTIKKDSSGKIIGTERLRENNGYWNELTIPEEASANMFATLVTNKDEFNRVKEIFPNAVKFFGKMLKSMVD